jgi:hypothetical protein
MERLRVYGLSLAAYDALMDAQGHGCAICGDACPSGRRLAVDHDHQTGRVRGLLCVRCNTLIGSARELPGVLHSAICYLEEWSGN